MMPPSKQTRIPPGRLFLAAVAAGGIVVAGVALRSTFGESAERVSAGVPFSDPGPVHVHGLGINDADGSLFIATHTGLFRVGKSSRQAVRVADRYQDTMGFSIVGANRFLGSGHPDARDQKLPPLLGLIESNDAGKTWTPISLLGETDFHVIRAVGRRVYGYDSSNERLLGSSDEGRSWRKLGKPAPLVDLAPDPSDPLRLVATAVGGPDEGTYASRDGGQSWKRLSSAAGLLAWPAAGRLYLVEETGRTLVSADGGRRLAERGDIGGRPAALLAVGKDELYVALHDGTIKRSTDGGATWTVRSRP